MADKEKMSCKYCPARFLLKESLEGHLMEKHKAKKCQRCSLCLTPRLMRTHICEPVKRPINCVACDYTCTVKSNMRRHYSAKHSMDARLAISEMKKLDAQMEMRIQGQGLAKVKARRSKKVEKEAKLKVVQEKKKMRQQRAKALEKKIPKGKSGAGRKCFGCGDRFSSKRELLQHVEEDHHPTDSPGTIGENENRQFGQTKTAFKGSYVSYKSNYEPGDVVDPSQLFRGDNSEDVVMYEVLKRGSANVKVTIYIVWKQYTNGGEDIIKHAEPTDFKRVPVFLSDLKRLPEFFTNLREQFMERMEMFNGEGSGWNLDHISSVRLSFFNSSRIFEGFSGGVHSKKIIDTYIREKFAIPSALINVKCPQQMCFYYAIAMWLAMKEDPSCWKYTHKMKKPLIYRLNELGIKMNMGKPASASLIDKFEKANCKKLQARVNIFLQDPEEDKIFPFYVSKQRQFTDSINILLLDGGYEGRPHFVLIRDLGLIMSKKEERSDLSKNKKKNHRKFPCENCLSVFWTKKARKNHQEICVYNESAEGQRVQVADLGEKVKFTNFERTCKKYFYGCLDFETREIPSKGLRRDTKTMSVVKELEAVSFSLVIIDRNNKILYNRAEKSQENCLRQLIDALYEAEALIKMQAKFNTPHNMSERTMTLKKKAAQKCWICDGTFPYSLEEEKKLLSPPFSSQEDIDEVASCGGGPDTDSDDDYLESESECEPNTCKKKKKKRKSKSLCRVIDHGEFLHEVTATSSF